MRWAEGGECEESRIMLIRTRKVICMMLILIPRRRGRVWSQWLCRWIRENQRFSRADCETAHKGEPQAVGCSGYRELVADPTTNSRWTPNTAHFCDGRLSSECTCGWRFHFGLILWVMISQCMYKVVLHLKMIFRLYLEQTTLTLHLLSFGSSRIFF